MMKKNIATLLLALSVVLGGVLLRGTVVGQSSGITVEGATAIATVSMSTSPDLEQSLARALPRVNSQFAQGHLRTPLLLNPDLRTMLEAVQASVVVQFSQGLARHEMRYPQELMAKRDTAAPLITSDIMVKPYGRNKVTFSLQTSEFTTMVVRYGTQSGSYTEEATTSLYDKQHRLEIDLSGLQGTTYYYIIEIADRSGNTETTPEGTFTQTDSTPPITTTSATTATTTTTTTAQGGELMDMIDPIDPPDPLDGDEGVFMTFVR